MSLVVAHNGSEGLHVLALTQPGDVTLVVSVSRSVYHVLFGVRVTTSEVFVCVFR